MKMEKLAKNGQMGQNSQPLSPGGVCLQASSEDHHSWFKHGLEQSLNIVQLDGADVNQHYLYTSHLGVSREGLRGWQLCSSTPFWDP